MKRDDDDDDDCRSLILLCVNDDVTRVHFVQVTSKIFGVDFCFLDYNAVNVCCMFSVTFTRTVVWLHVSATANISISMKILKTISQLSSSTPLVRANKGVINAQQVFY